jgi:hypothetical protein
MSDDRRRILKMLADDKISVAEAEELLDALKQRSDPDKTPTDREKKGVKYLRINVDPCNAAGKDKVNIRVPLQLIRAGAKLAAVIPGGACEKANQALREKGVDIDLKDLTGENLDKIIETLCDLSIDVDSEKEKVRIFCE